MTQRLLSNRFFRRLLFACIFAGTLAFSWFRTFDLHEFQTYDWRCQLRGPRPVSSDIVLIDIWDDTLKALGAWPFDRQYHAALIEALKTAQAKALVFDVLFVEPHPSDPRVTAAAKDAGNVYFAFAFSSPAVAGRKFVSDRIQSPLLNSYAEAAKATGFVNTKADGDGKRRRAIPAITYQGKEYYQFSFRVAMDALSVRPEEVVHRGNRLLFSDKRVIPLDDDGYYIVNYAGKWTKTFKHYSYWDIVAAHAESLAGEKPRLNLRDLKGKICFVGLTSTASHDANPIPIESVYPMVGSYANVLNSILNKDFIYRLDRFSNLIILALIALWIIRISFRLGPIRALFWTLVIMALYAGYAVTCFLQWGLWIDLFYPLVLFLGVYAATTLAREVFEMHKRERIENELKIASQIQRSFLPAAPPQAKGLDVAAMMRPAKAVGGDLYTFVPLAEGKTGVMVGDVSGKGTPAALFMAKVVSEFKFSARDHTDPAAALFILNNSITSESTGGLFVTLAYAIFESGGREVLLSSGGHLPVIRVGPGGEKERIAPGEGMPIGVMAGASYGNLRRTLVRGEIFAFYTDGVTEARNSRKQEFGEAALEEAIAARRDGKASEILNEVTARLQQFVGKAEQHDDVTLIIVKVVESHDNTEEP